MRLVSWMALPYNRVQCTSPKGSVILLQTMKVTSKTSGNAKHLRLIGIAIVVATILQLLRDGVGHTLDVGFPPLYSYRNNYIETAIFVGLSFILAVSLTSILNRNVLAILGLTSVKWSRQLLWVIPFGVYFLYLLVISDFASFSWSVLGLFIAVSYCCMSSFVVETHSRGIVASILQPGNIWMVTVVTGLLLDAQIFIADWVQYGPPPLSLNLAAGLLFQFAYAFAMTSLRFRVGSLLPGILISVPFYFVATFVGRSQPENLAEDVTITGLFLCWGIAMNISMRHREGQIPQALV
jgi:hypothetical protein